MRTVLQAHHQEARRALLFSDSEIVLSWLAKPAATWCNPQEQVYLEWFTNTTVYAIYRGTH